MGKLKSRYGGHLCQSENGNISTAWNPGIGCDIKYAAVLGMF
jgi:hypothetical protein